MPDYLQNITPDSISGILFALEGLERTVVLLNGPTGCKFYHSATSDNQTIRQFEFDPLNYPEKWYFGQPRVPCTYLDSRDYIYGSREKLTEALEFLRENVSFDLLCVVNSPGAALIGDDLSGIVGRTIPDKPYLTLETPGFSSDICSGYETAAIELAGRFGPKRAEKKKAGTVNILGLSIYHRNWAGDKEELSRLFRLCGIGVNCFLCAGCTPEALGTLAEAELNVVLNPEYGLKTAQYLKDCFGVPFYVCDGPPVGFSATEKMMREICMLLHAEDKACLTDSEKARGRVYPFVSRINSLTGLPKGVSFAVEGTYSELYAYIAFLSRYFGMIPECAAVRNERCDCFKGRLLNLLGDLGASDAAARDLLQTNSELVFASGNTIARLKLGNHVFSGIEIALPSLGYVDVVPKTHLGVRGALLLTEQVLNGVIF